MVKLVCLSILVLTAPEPSMTGLPLVEVVARLVYLAVLLAGGVAGSWLLWRIGRVRAFAEMHPWLPVLHAGLWGLIVFFLLRAAFPEASGVRPYTRMGLVALLGIIALPWLRNVFHGLVFALERRYRIGDYLRTGAIEGRVVALGVRAVTLRAADGTETAVPYTNLAIENVVRLNIGARDTPCELEVELPPAVSLERGLVLARTAASLTPLASPRRAPEVFISQDDPAGTRLRLRIRGYVFDREHEQRYTSDVLARLQSALRAEQTAMRFEPPRA